MKTERLRATLRANRTALAEELARLTAPPPPGTNLAFGKRIGEGTTAAVERLNATATARSIAAALEEVDRALAKLDEGSYGRCDGCGREIPAERLGARPSTSLCVDCSRRRG